MVACVSCEAVVSLLSVGVWGYQSRIVPTPHRDTIPGGIVSLSLLSLSMEGDCILEGFQVVGLCYLGKYFVWILSG